MIQIYNKDNTNYDQNGNIVLFPTECKMTAVLKGQWELTLEHPKDSEGRWEYIKEEAVICTDTFIGKKQLFPIYCVERDGETVIAKAYPIFFNSKNDVYFMDRRPTNETGQEALDNLMKDTVYSGTTNITKLSTAYYIRKNLIEALNGDIDQSFVNRWGGEPIYNNRQIIINDRAGGDYGVEIRYGKNLESINETVDMSNIVTRIVPVAFNGYILDGDEPWVDSPLINEYSRIYYQEVKFEKIKLATDATEEDDGDAEMYDTIEELREALKVAAKEQFEAGIDKPSVTLEISMIDLASTEEYKDYKILETVSIGDTAHCVHNELNIDTEARVNEIVWDCIRQVVDSLVIGDPNYNYFNSVTSATNAVEAVVNVKNRTVIAERVAGILNAMDTQLKYQKNIAQRQDVRAILFEDLDTSSNTYGAMCLGTQGFQIANKRTADDREWDWSTAATANGIIADAILTGLISDKSGSSWWNLDTGELQLQGIFNQYSNTGYPSVSIRDNEVKFYDWETNGDYVGSVAAIHQASTGRRGINVYCDNGDMLFLGWDSQDGTDGHIKTIMYFDSKTPNSTPWIRNTASGKLFPNVGNGVTVENGLLKEWSLNTASGIIFPDTFGGITVKDGLITEWSLNGASGSFNAITGFSLTNGSITSVTRIEVTVKNGLITGWSSSTSSS